MVVLAMLLAWTAVVSAAGPGVDPLWTTSMTKYKDALQDLLDKGKGDLPTKPRREVIKVIGEKLLDVVRGSHPDGSVDCKREGRGNSILKAIYFCYGQCKFFDLTKLQLDAVEPIERGGKPYVSIKFKFDALSVRQLIFVGNKLFTLAHNYLTLQYERDNLFELVGDVPPNTELADKWSKGECLFRIVDFNTVKLKLAVFDLQANCKGGTAVIKSFFNIGGLKKETNSEVWKLLKTFIPDVNNSLICMGERLQTGTTASPPSSTKQHPQSDKENRKLDEKFYKYCAANVDISNQGATDGSASP